MLYSLDFDQIHQISLGMDFISIEDVGTPPSEQVYSSGCRVIHDLSIFMHELGTRDHATD